MGITRLLAWSSFDANVALLPFYNNLHPSLSICRRQGLMGPGLGCVGLLSFSSIEFSHQMAIPNPMLWNLVPKVGVRNVNYKYTQSDASRLPLPVT